MSSSVSGDQEHEQFLSLLAGLECWSDGVVPDKVGTVKCNRAVTVPAGSEFLLRGTLPKNVKISPGSTVMTEPTYSHSTPRGLMVASVGRQMGPSQVVMGKIAVCPHCPRCVISNDLEGRAPLESIKTSAPLEIVCIDFWTAAM